MPDCKIEQNKQGCGCTYEPCDRKGLCCECLQYHWQKRQLPGCLFPTDVEKTYDRSLERFIQAYQKKAR